MDAKKTPDVQSKLEVVPENPNKNASPSVPEDGRKTAEANTSNAGHTTAISKDRQSPMYNDSNVLIQQQQND